MITETILQNIGVRAAPDGYWQGCGKLADEFGFLFDL